MGDKTRTTDSEDDITGHMIPLDETRFVFLGQSQNHPDAWFLCFRNSDGNDTKMALSREAMAALVKLATEPFRGERVTFPHKRVWRVVGEGDAD